MADSVKIKITGDASQFNKEVSSLGDRVKSAATDAGSVLKGMLASQVITKGISMLTGSIRSAISTGMEFEASMSQVAAISGATAEELEQLTAAARHYGETTKFTASESAAALNYMALAGWDVKQSLDALPGVLNLAAASGMDLARASDSVTDYISAFGMEASQAGYMADLMAYAQSNANTSANQLADAYGNCASSMHAAGQGIETTTAMLMALSNQGIKGSEAGTQLSAMMRDLTQKMKNGKITIGKTSVVVQDAAGNFRDLNDIMADVGKAVEGMGTAERSAAIMDTFTARSVKAVNTILNEGIENVNAYEAALLNSTGTAADQAATMMDNLQGDIQIFRSALEGLQITASDSFGGIAREIVQSGTSLLDDITRGGKSGGISGMFDAVIDAIPSLLEKATGGLEKLISGISGKLPALLKKFAGQLPNILKSALKLTPIIVKGLTDAAASAVETLAANLPEYVEQIFEALPSILESVFNAGLRVLDGLFKGLDTAIAKMGLRDWRFDERLQQQIDKIDPNLKKDLQIAATAEYTVESITVSAQDVQEEVDAALETIRSTLLASGLSEETTTAIINAVKDGSGYNAFVSALEAWGVPKEKAKAVAQSVSDAFDVFETTFTGLGLDTDAQDAITAAIESGADVETLTQMLVNYGVDTEEASAAAQTLITANDAKNAALAGCGLDPQASRTVRKAALDGAKVDKLTKLLTDYGVKTTDAEAAAQTIIEAGKLMNDTLAEIGLDEDAKTAISNAAASGAQIDELTALLVSYGVDETAANTAAETLASANETMNTALQGVGLNDKGAVIRFNAKAKSKSSLVRSALKLFDLSDVDTDTITASYDTVKSSVGFGFAQVVSDLHSSLTNGIPDEYDEDFKTAKQNIKDYCDAALTVIDEWEKDQIAELETQYSGTTLEDKIAEVKTQAEDMRTTIQTVVSDADSWADDAAGKSASYVNERIEELSSLIEQVYGIDAKMRELDASVISVNEADRRAVEGGYMTDPSKQAAAIAYTNYEYDRSIEANNRKRDQLIAEAALNLGGDSEAYAARVDELTSEYEKYNQDALTQYNEHLEKIMLGMLKDNPDLANAINGYKREKPIIDAIEAYSSISTNDWDTIEAACTGDIKNLADKVAELYGDEFGDTIQSAYAAMDFPDRFNLSELMFTALALEKGADYSDIKELLINGIEGLVGEDGEIQKEATDLFNDVDWGNILSVWQTAAQAGILENTEGYDTSDAMGLFDYLMNEIFPDHIDSSVLEAAKDAGTNASEDVADSVIEGAKDTLEENSPSKVMDEIGENAGIGLANGLIASTPKVAAAAARLAAVAEEAIREALQINSPSKVMEHMGEFTGEGFGIGLQDSINTALKAARSVVGLVNLAPKMDFSGVTGAFDGSIQSLADIENNRPINMYMNGKLVGQTMRRDNATAANQYNRSVALGVGG